MCTRQPVTFSIEKQDYYRLTTASIRFRLDCNFMQRRTRMNPKALTVQETVKVEPGLAGWRRGSECGLPQDIAVGLCPFSLSGASISTMTSWFFAAPPQHIAVSLWLTVQFFHT